MDWRDSPRRSASSGYTREGISAAMEDVVAVGRSAMGRFLAGLDRHEAVYGSPPTHCAMSRESLAAIIAAYGRRDSAALDVYTLWTVTVVVADVGDEMFFTPS